MIDTPEIELDISVTFPKETDLNQIAQVIEQRLQEFSGVDQVAAVPRQVRMGGVEIAAVLAITVLALRGSQEVVKELHVLIQELKNVLKDVRGQEPSLTIGDRRISLKENELSKEEIADVVASWYETRWQEHPTILRPPPYFDICIVCALTEEAKACIDVIEQRWQVKVLAGFSPISHEYGYVTIKNNKDEQLTIHISWLHDYGPSKATIQLMHVIETYRPLFVGMTGVCAGDKKKVKLGDIIVADRAFLYDSGKYVEGTHGQPVHLFDVDPYRANAGLIQFVRMFDTWKKDVARLPRPASKHQQRDWLLGKLLVATTPRVQDIPLDERTLYAPSWREIVSELQKEPTPLLSEDLALINKERIYLLDEFPFQDPEEPGCYIATVASSSAVRSDNPFSEAQIPLRKTLAFDMEGAALYEVAAGFPHVQALMVKGVSDYGDREKDDTYHQYASTVSALYMLSLISNYATSQRIHGLREAN